ncbi:hypothetical protein PRIPAC_81476 [Pristionchus pacificus]|uniref:Uncharacterized protein n=1 Tax=Pristionchus pacificus TaxID=54126 RepID=A0A8R1UI78_PRIPA|nr:hypothetical protein PRIPAC_81476 [Pristionchus pacificus]
MRLQLLLASLTTVAIGYFPSMLESDNVIEQVLQYSKIRDHFAFSTPAEKSNMIIDDLFIKYPNLKPETDKGESNHTQLAHVLKRLMIISKREFEKLSKEEREYLGKVSEYVIHKLCILGVWRVHDKKELRYFGNASEMLGKGWTRDEYREMSMKQGAAIAKKWGIDSDEIIKE